MAVAVMAYATSTGTRRNIEAMRAHGISLLITPTNTKAWPGMRYAIDNGAFGAWQSGREWAARPWLDLLRQYGERAEWSVLPDIVHGGVESLALSLRYLQQVRKMAPLHLIAVQDGMTADDIRPHVGERVGIFVGGSTEWKERSLPVWGRLASETGCYLHVGRVNTNRRIKLCAMAGADSFDGTSATRFAVTVPRIAAAAAQGAFLWDA